MTVLYAVFCADLGDVGHPAIGVVDVKNDLCVVLDVGEFDALDHLVADGGDVVAARHHLLGYAEDRLDVAASARRVHHLHLIIELPEVSNYIHTEIG